MAAETARSIRDASTRRFTRVLANFPMRLRLGGDGGTRSCYRAWAIDWSPLGARVASYAPLRVGQTFEVAEAGDPQTFVPCRVAWASPPQADESRQFGIEFLPQDTESSLSTRRN